MIALALGIDKCVNVGTYVGSFDHIWSVSGCCNLVVAVGDLIFGVLRKDKTNEKKF